MARAFILSPKLSDRSAITGSSSVANAVAVNVLRARPHLYWRSTEDTPHLEGNFGVARDIDTFFLGYLNSQEADTFRLKLASSQANLSSSPLYDSEPVSVWPGDRTLSDYLYPHRVFILPITVSAQWYRVEFGFGSNTSGYVQLSRCILGKRIEPEVSVQSKWAIGGNEEVAESVDMGGEESPRGMGTRRSITVTWHDLSEEEREKIYATLLERGSSRDIVLAIEPHEGDYSMSRVFVGRVKQVFSFEQTLFAGAGENGQHFTISLTVTEMAPIQMA